MTRKNKKQAARVESTLLKRVREAGATSRVELARDFELAPSTAGTYVSRLLADGFLLEGERRNSELGRPSSLLSLNPQAGQFIGVDIDAGDIYITRLDFNGQLQEQSYFALRETDNTNKALDEIATGVHKLYCESAGPLLGVGVGVPGIVDPVRGIAIRNSHFTHWHNLNLKSALEERVGVPVSIENTVRAMALAELTKGWGRDLDNFICLAVRSGLGASIVINRQIYHGATFSPGEIGLTPLLTEQMGVPNRHLQDVASIAFILESLAAEGSNVSQVGDIVRAYHNGDQQVIHHTNHAIEMIAQAAVQLACILNPQKIILCGPLGALDEALLEPIRRQIRNIPYISHHQSTEIVIAQFAEYEGAIGAAAHAINEWNITEK